MQEAKISLKHFRTMLFGAYATVRNPAVPGGSPHGEAVRKPPAASSGHGTPVMPTRGAIVHLRVLNASAPMQPHVPSCYLTLSVGVYTGSLFQPGTHGCFLMHPAPWTATEKAA